MLLDERECLCGHHLGDVHLPSNVIATTDRPAAPGNIRWDTYGRTLSRSAHSPVQVSRNFTAPSTYSFVRPQDFSGGDEVAIDFVTGAAAACCWARTAAAFC